MCGNGAVDTAGILDESVDDSDGDESENGVEDIDQTHWKRIGMVWVFTLEAKLKSDEKASEDNNECLLDADLSRTLAYPTVAKHEQLTPIM